MTLFVFLQLLPLAVITCRPEERVFYLLPTAALLNHFCDPCQEIVCYLFTVDDASSSTECVVLSFIFRKFCLTLHSRCCSSRLRVPAIVQAETQSVSTLFVLVTVGKLLLRACLREFPCLLAPIAWPAHYFSNWISSLFLPKVLLRDQLHSFSTHPSLRIAIRPWNIVVSTC